MVALREPALGPTFGIKVVQLVVVMRKSYLWKISTYISTEISMRLPTANNALSAFIDNRIHQG